MSGAATKLLIRQADLIHAQLGSERGARVLLVNPSVGMAEQLAHAGFNCTSWVLNAQALGADKVAQAVFSGANEPPTEQETQPASGADSIGYSSSLFQAYLTAKQQVAGVILNIPKEKQLSRMLLANLRAVVPVGTPIWLVGHNETGIRSYLKQEHAGWQKFAKLASGNHCQLLSGALLSTAPFQLAEFLSTYNVMLPSATASKQLKSNQQNNQESLAITNLPGVFSSGHLDLGTQLLLENLPEKISGKVLDFGCGAGVISAYLAKRFSPIEISAVDINVLALEATKSTLENLGVHAEIFASDGLAHVHGHYQWIISNPPFHSGKQTDYKITQDFIRESRNKLKADGSLLIVANTFLPYREALSENFKYVNILAHTPKFTVWHASNRAL
ncbi:hypothetical protein CWE08_02825 [Aliidiomarina iranensis]|uniref:Ribosomal RNA small subunit methyltransferase C n=1 Tax=Aliidiomarina iranensis TaxID=1434071 RepID=A0A432W387_9GAMM|nr:class I SAM-dependent methyltransferase [Aliidiomarina iranensis]RUO23596.1 hypothetical protein CWE08_02825 [Aliidiomarina iranensis]